MIYATPNITITGNLGFTVAVRPPNSPTDTFVNITTSFSDPGVYALANTAGVVSGTEIAVVDLRKADPGDYDLFILDSRGNWSNTISITIPNCAG